MNARAPARRDRRGAGGEPVGGDPALRRHSAASARRASFPSLASSSASAPASAFNASATPARAAAMAVSNGSASAPSASRWTAAASLSSCTRVSAASMVVRDVWHEGRA